MIPLWSILYYAKQLFIVFVILSHIKVKRELEKPEESGEKVA